MGNEATAAAIRARHFLTTLKQKQSEGVETSLGEYGVVSLVSGSTVAVRLTRDTDAGSQLFARAAGPTLNVGDPVALIPMRGGGYVAVKIGGSEIPQPLQDLIVNIRASAGNAFSVETSAGADVFFIDTNNTVVRTENGALLVGYSDGAEAIEEWRIDGTTGRGTFSGGVEVGVGESLIGGSIQGSRMIYHTSIAPVGLLSGVTLAANRVYYVLVYAPRSMSCDAFVYEVTTAVSGSVQCGLYTNVASMLPDARIVLGSKTAQSTTGVKTQTQTAVGVEGGRFYWVALCSTVAMAISGNTLGQTVSWRGGATSSSNFIMCYEDIAAGWTNIPSNATPIALGNTYLHVGARNA